MKFLALSLIVSFIFLLFVFGFRKWSHRRSKTFTITPKHFKNNKSLQFYLDEIEEYFLSLNYQIERTDQGVVFKPFGLLENSTSDTHVSWDSYSITITSDYATLKVLLSHLDIQLIFS